MRNRYLEYLSEAKTALVSGRYPEAMKCCEKALEIQPASAEAHYQLGMCCMISGGIDRAIRAFGNAIKFHPEDGEAYFALGSCQFTKEEYAEALNSFTKAEQYGVSKKGKKKMYYYMGLINEQQKKMQGAQYYYDLALSVDNELNDETKNILTRKIAIWLSLKNLEKAEYYATQLKIVAPEEFNTHKMLFQIRLAMKRVEQAEVVLKEAEVFFGEQPEMLIKIGHFYADLYRAKARMDSEHKEEFHDNEKACLLAILRSTERSEKDVVEVLKRLAYIYKEANETEELIEISEKLLAYGHVAEEYEINFAKKNLIDAYASNKEYGKALNYAKELQNSKDVGYKCHGIYSEAYITRELGKSIPAMKQKAMELYHAAIAYYRNCMVSKPADYNALMYRIQANVDIGNRDKAKELYQLLPENFDTEREFLKTYIMEA